MPAQEELKTLCAEPSGSGCDDFAREKPPLRSINRLPLRRMAEKGRAGAKRCFCFLWPRPDGAPPVPMAVYSCCKLKPSAPSVTKIRSERYLKSASSVPTYEASALHPVVCP